MEMIQSIKEEVKEGQFSSVSEFIRHLVRAHKTKKLLAQLKKDDEAFDRGEGIDLNEFLKLVK
jgi:Arc/MetJ-type ribon-helix-helix transcriptional regulator